VNSAQIYLFEIVDFARSLPQPALLHCFLVMVSLSDDVDSFG